MGDRGLNVTGHHRTGASITNSYSTGSVTQTGSGLIGGLAGFNFGSINNSCRSPGQPYHLFWHPAYDHPCCVSI